MKPLLNTTFLFLLLTVGFAGGVSGQDFEETKRLAEQGSAVSQFNLGFKYDRGEGVPENDAEAVRWYRLAAEQGHAEAQFYLGIMYHFGNGVPGDYVEAVRWYRLAAEQGFANAQQSLGLMYRSGDGVPENHVEAVRWFRLAAEQGFGPAQYNLATMYERGDGVPENKAEAIRWYRLAAEQGHAASSHVMGTKYHLGDGVPEDYAEAARWYRLAAEQGNLYPQPMFELGMMYVLGQGVPQDDVEAIRWFRQYFCNRTVAVQGASWCYSVAETQSFLGNVYERKVEVGEGPAPLNYLRAYIWYSVAAAQGNSAFRAPSTELFRIWRPLSLSYENAREGRDRNAEKLTPEQLARGQDIATRCFESDYQDCE